MITLGGIAAVLVFTALLAVCAAMAFIAIG